MRNWLRMNFPYFYSWLIFIRHSFFYYAFYRKSYAQFGEDLLISHLFTQKSNGFYIDVGAHRPTECSNTYYFYRRGWRGINMDAMPGSMGLFKWVRPNDINLEMAIAEQKKILTYYLLDSPLMNGFYPDDSALEKDGLKNCKIINKIQIETNTLAEVLDRYLPDNQSIDFLSIDVEGLDLEVLKSNNWEKYKPKVILIEILNFDFAQLSNYEIYQFLSNQGYQFYSRTVNTLIFSLK